MTIDSQPVVQAIKQLATLTECDLVIISDANSIFIQEILQHHLLLDCFQQACKMWRQGNLLLPLTHMRGIKMTIPGCQLQVFTNVGEWDGETLRVRPFHDEVEPHSCSNCPSNLCKGLVSAKRLA